MAHDVALTWTPSTDSTSADPGTANVYRSTDGGKTYEKIATSVAAGGPYSDTNVTPGEALSYEVTAVIGGAESAPSAPFQGVVPIAAPTGLTGVVQ